MVNRFDNWNSLMVLDFSAHQRSRDMLGLLSVGALIILLVLYMPISSGLRF